MRYKLHPEVAERVPFDPTCLDRGQTAVIYDDVEFEDITDQERDDVTFFCIDVEGTHNFVTAGGVVHNCRPPGNRDPLPLEIENCREYLYRQVELIQPRVICSLGNFSTKLLRGDPTGITRLHGKAEELTLGARTVRLYPIFHPAAALYTPRMLETLREDFARLPDLLAQPEPPQPQPDLEPPEPDPSPEPDSRSDRGPDSGSEPHSGRAPERGAAAAGPADSASQLGLF
jgi:DNA polymerase